MGRESIYLQCHFGLKDSIFKWNKKKNNLEKGKHKIFEIKNTLSCKKIMMLQNIGFFLHNMNLNI